MKQYFKILLFITLISQSTFGFTQESSMRFGYDARLVILINEIMNDFEIDDSALLFSIPQSQKEYSLLYSLTYQTSQNSQLVKDAYYKRLSMIQDKLKQGDVEFLKAQMIFSQYIDGEEAEDFFESMNHFNTLNPDNFCKAYTFLKEKFGDEKFKRLRTLEIECLK